MKNRNWLPILLILSIPAFVTAQVVINPGGGGGSSSITSGTTPITGGTDTRVCFNDAAVINCNDAGLTYTKATGTLAPTIISLPATGSASATVLNYGTATVGMYGNSSTLKFVAGSDKLWIDNTTTTSWNPILPNSAGSQSIGSSGTPWLDGFFQGWIKGTMGEIALNADYTNATASFTNTALSLTVTSGRTYNFHLHLTFADSTAADGAQFDFNGGAATVTNFRVQCTASNATGAALVLTNAGTTALATAVQVALALTTQAGLECDGTFVPSSTNTFIVRAAQTAHTAGTLTVHRGSWLSLKDARPL